MDITQVSILHHIGIVLIGLWILSACNCSHPVVYLISFIYLFLVNERYTLRLRRKLHFQERKQSYQRRLLSDSETVRWLNHAVEKIWPICMEEIASQNFLLPIIPWFLDKYKPWTAEKAVIENLYLGRSPPIFTEIRVLGQSTDDDHLVLELGMNFLSADDMNAALAVKLRKRLGFGMWAKMHITGMHVEGKVLVGVKFLRQWPFLGRLRVCFVEPPYFQMTVKPLFNHGIDVTELPGIAGWLDNLLAVAFDQTLVEPNMLVVDVEKFVSAPTEKWFSVYEKRPIAFVRVEILEGADMKPSDLNGLADPYVKGQFGPYRFRTKIQRKTLCPKWQEEFKIPICTWESLNELRLEVRDKDHFVDDTLGDCSVKISELRDGQRHDMWLPLQNIKVGRLHLAITVTGVDEKGEEQVKDVEVLHKTEEADLVTSEDAVRQDIERTTPLEKVPKGADELEPINIEGQERTGIWVHHPGNEIPPTWEPRKGRSRLPETQLLPGVITSHNSDDSSDEENPEGNKVSTIRRSLRKIGSLFHRRPKGDASSDKGAIPSPRANIRAVGEKGTAVTIIVEDNFRPKDVQNAKDSPLTDNDEGVSPGKSHNIKGVAKSFLKQAGGGLKHVLSQKGSHKSKGGADLTMSGKEMNEDSSTDESIPTSSREYTPKSDGGLLIQGTLLSSKASPERRQECLQTGSMNSENDIDGLPTGKECLEPADIEQDSVNENLRKTSVRRKVSFEGINPVDHPVSEKPGSLHQEGKGESLVSVAVDGNTEIQKL